MNGRPDRSGNRRGFVRKLFSVGALWAGGTYANVRSQAAPALPALADATDAHHHIYDSRFPPDPSATLRPPDATVDDYRRLQKRIGVVRHVAVQPSTYGTDNSCLVDALSRFGNSARGIAVVNTTVSDAELKRLDLAGVCGLRFNFVQAGATGSDMIEPLSKRIEKLGWHVQINASAEQILSGTAMWNRLPVQVVFDHFGHTPDVQSPVFRLLRDLMQQGKAWTKISGVETISKVGPPDYSDGGVIAEAFIKAAPDRLLWGTNWPYTTSRVKPDDLVLLNLLTHWTKDEAMREKILVENPAQLFGFR